MDNTEKIPIHGLQQHIACSKALEWERVSITAAILGNQPSHPSKSQHLLHGHPCHTHASCFYFFLPFIFLFHFSIILSHPIFHSPIHLFSWTHYSLTLTRSQSFCLNQSAPSFTLTYIHTPSLSPIPKIPLLTLLSFHQTCKLAFTRYNPPFTLYFFPLQFSLLSWVLLSHFIA